MRPARRTVSEAVTQQANRREWDGYADEYQATHGEFLGDVGFLWCPERVDEADAALLGDVTGRPVLEVGCGAGQCSRWLSSRGARPVGLDISERQLQHSRRIDGRTGHRVPVVLGTATALPFADASFDVVFSAFGALQFVQDAGRAVDEAARVLRPHGVLAFSVSHPVRWCLPDDPTSEGLVVSSSYWDRTPYLEEDETGHVTYAEHHRTVGDWVGLLAAAGFRVTGLVEPEWPEGLERIWGGWGPERGRLLPGTAIFTARLDGSRVVG
jgi:ubiquinone/menaquinone biosynthesis C-methylase UbiE